MKEELLKGLSEEQIEKVKACKDHSDLLQLAKDEGVELNDEQLNAVSGGCTNVEDKQPQCPNCGSTNTTFDGTAFRGTQTEYWYRCGNCGNRFL